MLTEREVELAFKLLPNVPTDEGIKARWNCAVGLARDIIKETPEYQDTTTLATPYGMLQIKSDSGECLKWAGNLLLNDLNLPDRLT